MLYGLGMLCSPFLGGVFGNKTRAEMVAAQAASAAFSISWAVIG